MGMHAKGGQELLRRQSGLEKAPAGLRREEPEFQGLGPEAERNRQPLAIRGQETGVDDFVVDFKGFARKVQAPKTPVRDVDDVPRRAIGRRQVIVKMIPGRMIKPYPAIAAGEQPVRFFQDNRRSTLRAFMLDLPVQFFHHIDCSKRNWPDSPFRSAGICSTLVSVPQAGRSAGRIGRSAVCSCRTGSTC